MDEAQAAYLHVPFCRHRCGYCNFTLVAGRDDLIGTYLDAIERELSWLQQPRPVRTLFFGGGTPTHLSEDELRRLFRLARQWFPWDENDVEISIEANPNDLTPTKLGLLQQLGVTRISLGIQSWDRNKLQLLERDHRADTIAAALEAARAHIASVSMDLIFGVPNEARSTWQTDLARTLEFTPDHVSTYGLTYERGTSYWSRQLRGEIAPLAEDDERWMYEAGIDTLQAAGYEHYEVSNFARPGHRCRHNEVYWKCESYYAVGPGASRYLNGTRETNHRSTTTYLKRVLSGQSPVAERETLSSEESARERLVFGLRRIQGVDLRDFRAVTGYDAFQLGGADLARFCDQGLLAHREDRLRLTRAGLLISDSLWPHLL